MLLRLRTQALPQTLSVTLLFPLLLHAGARAKPHTVGIGAGKHVPYSLTSDPAGAAPEENPIVEIAVPS